MTKNLNCTTGAPQSLGSLLSTSITPSTVQANVPLIILPLASQLPPGNYASEIISVSDAIQNGDIIGIDCVHRLTDSDDHEYLVKFRFFAPKDIQPLVDILAGYGLTGNLGSALVGLRENVKIVPRPGSQTYMSIGARTLAMVNAVSSTPVSKTSLLNKSGSLGRKSREIHKSKVRNLLEDDDDPEFDDFLEEDDE